MGELTVHSEINTQARAEFIRHLLNDIEALDIMLRDGLIEDDITRIGAEQEFCLVNPNFRPANNASQILEAIDDPHFTTELAKYNLEINLDPEELKGSCLSEVENKLNQFLLKAKTVAKKFDTKVILTGILPTISRSELQLEYMTPYPRYFTLNKMMKEYRGSDFELKLKGVDELCVIHESVLFEACNTSFQLHLQIASDDFISSYNWAQAISGPILGIVSNSPLLLGREIWSETRIALFQQSIDTRSSSYAIRNQQARVTFGDSWAQGNAADIFKNDIARYQVILSRDIEVSSLTELEEGRIPKLPALNLHNGTIYRWNRPCYGVGGGKPHLRIENRYIPSGPSTLDEMANFAFWVGLMKGRPSKFDDMNTVMEFKEAKSNFIKSARHGKESVMNWEGELYSVRDLISKEFLPLAYAGLSKVGIDKNDIERYLSVIEKRASGQTGSQWMIRNYRKLRKSMKQDDALRVITRNIYTNQQEMQPVHSWKDLTELSSANEEAEQVGHIMSTQIFSIDQDALADMATSVMEWKNIHHLPIEDKHGKFVGLLTWTHMMKYKDQSENTTSILVSDIMEKEVITVEPEHEIVDAIRIMKENEIGCLPVISENQLVGIITIPDVIQFDNGQSPQ